MMPSVSDAWSAWRFLLAYPTQPSHDPRWCGCLLDMVNVIQPQSKITVLDLRSEEHQSSSRLLATDVNMHVIMVKI